MSTARSMKLPTRWVAFLHLHFTALPTFAHVLPQKRILVGFYLNPESACLRRLPLKYGEAAKRIVLTNQLWAGVHVGAKNRIRADIATDI